MDLFVAVHSVPGVSWSLLVGELSEATTLQQVKDLRGLGVTNGCSKQEHFDRSGCIYSELRSVSELRN